MLDGVFAALVEAERTPVNFITLGDHATAEALLRKSGRHGAVEASELIERASPDRRLSLRLPPHPRRATLLRELVGSSLLIVAPLCCVVGERGAKPGRGPRLRGPLASSLGSFAAAHGHRPPLSHRPSSALRPGARKTTSSGDDRGAALGHALLSASFASAALLLDASWLALVDQDAPSPPPSSRLGGRLAPASAPVRTLAELESPERVLGLAELGRLELQAALDFDAWLARTLGFEAPGPHRAPAFSSPPGRWPRPRLHTATSASTPKRLAERAIAGLREQAARLRPALPPTPLPSRVPGSFAQLWAQRWYSDPSKLSPERDLGPR